MYIPLDGDVYGQKIEIPTPLFSQGFLLKLFSCQVEDRYLCLPVGREDRPGSYIRCSKPPKNILTISTCDSRFHPQYGRAPEKIEKKDVVRFMPLARSRIDQGYVGRLAETPNRTFEEKAALYFSNYLFAVSVGIDLDRDPSLTFKDWILRQSPESQVRLQEILDNGILDRCIELHRLHYLPRQ